MHTAKDQNTKKKKLQEKGKKWALIKNDKEHSTF